MMNLLARILSHGFAFAVVAIIVIVLIYRGEFSPGWELPDFLAINKQSGTTEKADSGTVERTAELPATMPEPPAAAEPAEPAEPATTESEDIQPAEEVPAAIEAIDVAPDDSSDPTPATNAYIPEEPDVSSVTEPAAVTESTDQATDDAPVPGVAILNDEPGTTEGDSLATATATEVTAPEVVAPTAAETAPEETEPVAAAETPSEEAEPVAAEVVPVEATPIVAEEPEPTPEAVPATETLAAPVQEEPTPSVADTATETPYEVMAKARESYWLRDFEAAEQHYRTLTQLDPDNPDGYGEMGNMYFSQGKWDEAAAAFYEAGTRLVKSGHIVQAQQMVEVIRGLNSPQAEDLEAQVTAASN